jgi:hypothetical protein
MHRVMLEDALKPENLNPIVDSETGTVLVPLAVLKRLVLRLGLR